MLTAEFSGSPGGLGWGLSSITSGIKSAVKSATDAASGAASAVKSAGSSASSAVQQGAQATYDAAKTAASAACGVVSKPAVQTGASYAAEYGKIVPVYGTAVAAAGTGTKVANFVCGMAYLPPAPVGPPSSPVQPKTQNPILTSLNLSPPAVLVAPPVTSRYKAGSMTRFNVTRGIWNVYSPLQGILGCNACVRGLGENDVDPPVPVGFVKAGEELAPPADVAQAGQEKDKTPLWKNPYFWLALGGGATALGGGYYLLRRKRR